MAERDKSYRSKVWSKTAEEWRPIKTRIIWTLLTAPIGAAIEWQARRYMSWSPLPPGLLGALLAPLLVGFTLLVIYRVRAGRKLYEALESQVIALEAQHPRVEAQIEKEGSRVLLRIQNYGASARFFAKLLRVEGTIDPRWIQIKGEVFARWNHADSREAMIPSRSYMRLFIASIDVDRLFEEGRWKVWFTTDAGVPGHFVEDHIVAGRDGGLEAWHDRPVERDKAYLLIRLDLFADPPIVDSKTQIDIEIRGLDIHPHFSSPGDPRLPTASEQAPPS